MDLLKELYAFESYFLTKKGLELGDKRWLEKHLINFMDLSPVIFKDITTLFRRVLRTMLKPYPNTKVSIRNNKREFVVDVTHPVLDLLPGGRATIPYRALEAGIVARPHLPHLRTTFNAGRFFYFPGVGTSMCSGSLENRFCVGTNIIQLSSGSYPPYRHYYSAADARGSAKIFVGDNSFMSFADEIESYVIYLEALYVIISNVLEADIEDMVYINDIQTPMTMVVQPGTNFDLDAYLDVCVTEQKGGITNGHTVRNV